MKPKPNTKAANTDLIKRMDDLATNMLDAVQAPDTAHFDKLDTFEKVGKWIAIRNRLEGDDGGTGIDAYKSRLRTPPRPPDSAALRATGPRGTDSWSHARAKHIERLASPDNGGPELDALKSRLPTANARGADGDRDGTGGEDDPAAGGGRGLHSGPAGNA